MSGRLRNQVLALAGIFQAGYLVDRLANSGQVEASPFETTIGSILQLDPRTTEDVYSGIDGVRRGLQVLRDILGSSEDANHGAVVRYVINLLHLERKLSGNREMLMVLRARLEQANQQARHFDVTHENVLASLDSIYQDTLSTFPFRIQVTGESVYLRDDAVAHKVRALLLAGVRSAMLWRQLGGRRWHLLFRRRRLQETCDALLEA